MYFLLTYITKLDVLEFIWVCDVWNHLNFHIDDALNNDDILKDKIILKWMNNPISIFSM